MTRSQQFKTQMIWMIFFAAGIGVGMLLQLVKDKKHIAECGSPSSIEAPSH